MHFNATFILNYYSSPFFYGFLVYIGIISLLMHVSILCLFTDISLKTIFKPMPYIALLSLLFTLIAAPLGMIISGYLAEYFYGPLTIKYFQTMFFLICTITITALMQQLLRKKFVKLSHPENQKFLIAAACLSTSYIVYSLKSINLI